MNIKQIRVLKAAKSSSRGELLTEQALNERRDGNMPQMDSGLLQFTKGSGFEQHAVKQLVGDEFKFVLNDYPDICKFAVASDQFRTAKLRIYKVYTQK